MTSISKSPPALSLPSPAQPSARVRIVGANRTHGSVLSYDEDTVAWYFSDDIRIQPRQNPAGGQVMTEPPHAVSHTQKMGNCWCRLVSLGSPDLCGFVFGGFWKTHTYLLVLSFFFLYELLKSGGWVRYFPLQLSVTTVFHARQFFFFSLAMF